MKVEGPLYFEDFAVGQIYETDSWTVTEEEVIAFGRKYAPLPYHTGVESARETSFGELIAAGYQTASITFSLFARTEALQESGMGSPGVDKLRWKRPVKPGDTLTVEVHIVEISPATTPEGRNGVRLRYDTLNQHGEVVMTLTSLHFVKTRSP